MPFLRISVFVFLLPCVGWHKTSAQSCTHTRDLVEYINKLHIEPRELDDAFSRSIFSAALDQLDPRRTYLTKQDSVLLSGFATRLDDLIRAQSCEFVNEATSLLRRRAQIVYRFMDSLLRSPLNYSRQETLAPLSGASVFPKDHRALKEIITRELTLEVYNRAARLVAAERLDFREDSFRKYEASAREKVRARLVAGETSLLKTLDEKDYAAQMLWKSVCKAYDPHTEFLTAAEAERFQTEIRSTEKSFGIEVAFSRSGDPSISRLLPGGPAWKSNLLKEGDQLISMKPMEGSAVDLADLDEAEVLDRLHDPAVTTAELSVKRTDGRLLSVTLTKEKLENTENLISSFVLSGPLKAGYIALPGFYTSPEAEPGRGCGEDIAREVIKLKKEGIQGLILDLRYNGGGSLQEVIDLAGIFINFGPLGILEQKGAPPVTLRDQNRGSIYDGPLVILTNRLSASASEFIAAALQDYNRALIVGATTYGKATGQQVVTLPSNLSNGGQLKVTMHRIYRVNGESLQRSGVLPDIHLPEITELFQHDEASQANAMFPKTIVKKTFYTPGPPLPAEVLREKSKERTAETPEFDSLDSLMTLLAKPVPLDIKAYIGYTREAARLLGSLQKSSSAIAVRPTGIDQQLHKIDSYHQQISEKGMQEIQQSFYIREALQILAQWLQFKK